jgi:hypothetical protein
VLPAVQAALRMPRDLRRAEVSALLDELIAIGSAETTVAPLHAPTDAARPEPAAPSR